MIIGIDLDNTLVCTTKKVHKLAARNLNLKKLPPAHDYWYTGWPENIRTEVLRLYRDPEFMGGVEPYTGVKDKLIAWKKEGHTLIILTARSKNIRKVTKSLVNRHFPMIDILDFVDMGKSKESLFKKYRLNYWIDDNPIDVQNSVKMGIQTCLISNSDTPYNLDAQGTFKRYASVRDINFY